MADYSDPVAAMRALVKDMQAKSEMKRREAREAEIAASYIMEQAVHLDLLADKVEHAARASVSGGQ